MMKIQQMKKAAVIAGLAAFSGIVHAAVVTPYTADFGTDAGKVDVFNSSDFVVSNPDSATLGEPIMVTQADSLQMTITTNAYANAYAAVATDLSAVAKKDFSMTSTVTMGSAGGNSFTRFGFSLLGDSNIANTGITALFYPNQGTGSGQLRFRDYDFGSGGYSTLDRTAGSVADASAYTFTLSGTFNVDGDLTLSFSVIDANGDGSGDVLSDTILAAALPTGDEFGVAGRIRDGFSADYGNLTVIPEPATIGLIGMCGIGMLVLRRFKI